MTQQVELMRMVDKLPPGYFGEAADYLEYLQQKAQQAAAQSDNTEEEIAAYKAMAADTEREKEASEWCNAYFGPAKK
jgi:alpha-D-ribose 1-methylphosphonate 5-triphosphate diphosphatase PhnM